ncbi:sulfurtransferase [Nocardia heshunensis]
MTTTQQGRPDSRADRALVDPHRLAAHLADPRVQILEIDVSPAAFDAGHIPGAVLWNIYRDLKDDTYRTVDAAALQRLVTDSGIRADSTVVCYGYAPALGVWLLKLFGHKDVRILDCSRDAWQAAGHPWSVTADTPAPGDFRLSEPDPRVRADRTAVLEAIGRAGTTLVDVRSAAEYAGECFWPSGAMEPDGRAGHVPSAVHRPLDGLLRADGSFRSTAELRDVLATLDGELITYCTVGGRAATAWFVLTALLGHEDVRVYDGSWAEWGRCTSVPVA